MSYTLANGPLGLQARHTWWADTDSGFTMNDTAYGLPQTYLDKITGLFSLPEYADTRDPVIGGNGEVIYPSYSRGKTITYEGRLIAPDGDSLYAYRWQMMTVFGNRVNAEGTMNITPHPTYGSGYWYFLGRVLALDIDEEIITSDLGAMPSPYQSHFILSIRSKDGAITSHS